MRRALLRAACRRGRLHPVVRGKNAVAAAAAAAGLTRTRLPRRHWRRVQLLHLHSGGGSLRRGCAPQPRRGPRGAPTGLALARRASLPLSRSTSCAAWRGIAGVASMQGLARGSAGSRTGDSMRAPPRPAAAAPAPLSSGALSSSSASPSTFAQQSHMTSCPYLRRRRAASALAGGGERECVLDAPRAPRRRRAADDGLAPPGHRRQRIPIVHVRLHTLVLRCGARAGERVCVVSNLGRRHAAFPLRASSPAHGVDVQVPVRLRAVRGGGCGGVGARSAQRLRLKGASAAASRGPCRAVPCGGVRRRGCTTGGISVGCARLAARRCLALCRRKSR